MKIVLIALLYATPSSGPIVHTSEYMYKDIKKCSKDADYAKVVFMEGAPYSDSFVETYCVVLPSGA
jgi:hypothetical protein